MNHRSERRLARESNFKFIPSYFVCPNCLKEFKSTRGQKAHLRNCDFVCGVEEVDDFELLSGDHASVKQCYLFLLGLVPSKAESNIPAQKITVNQVAFDNTTASLTTISTVTMSSNWRDSNPIVKEGLAELMGTFILCAFGIGSVAQYVLASQAFGGYWSVNWGWGMGVALGIYWAGGISGGHINPAVSLAMALTGRLSRKKLPVYIICQLLGAILASAFVYVVYYDYLQEFSGTDRSTAGKRATAGIWSTYPPSHVSNCNGFIDQMLVTALFVGCIFAFLDEKNIGPQSNLAPLLIGLTVLTAGTSFGINAGFGLNPARDLGPRIFTAMAGWGSEPFTSHGGWWIWAIVGQMLGGAIGGLVYNFTVGSKKENKEE